MLGGSREESPPFALGDALEQRSMNAGRFALTAVALAAGCLVSSPAWSLGLGRLSVQSSLGETLRAEIDVTSITAEETSSLNLRVASPDAYRAAGVEYNAALSGATVTLQRRPDGRPRLGEFALQRGEALSGDGGGLFYGRRRGGVTSAKSG